MRRVVTASAVQNVKRDRADHNAPISRSNEALQDELRRAGARAGRGIGRSWTRTAQEGHPAPRSGNDIRGRASDGAYPERGLVVSAGRQDPPVGGVVLLGIVGALPVRFDVRSAGSSRCPEPASRSPRATTTDQEPKADLGRQQPSPGLAASKIYECCRPAAHRRCSRCGPANILRRVDGESAPGNARRTGSAGPLARRAGMRCRQSRRPIERCLLR